MSVYKREWKDRKKREHFCWYFHKTVDGKRWRVAIPTARTKAQAEVAEGKILAQIHAGTYGKPTGEMLLKDFYKETYLPWAKANKRSWKIDTSRIKPILKLFGNKRLRDVSAFDGEKLKITLLNEPIVYKNKKGDTTRTKKRSVATVNRVFLLFSAVLRLAVLKKEIQTNPLREVNTLDGEKHRTRYMFREEEARLMLVLADSCREHLRLMMILTINTGLREMELFTLRPEHVDLNLNIIHVKDTKTGEDREVPINDTARRLLEGQLSKVSNTGHRYLFTNPKTGKHYTTVKTAWATACRLAGITNLRWHDIRHTFGTRAIENGASLPDLQKVMGHRRIETTMQYVHATDRGRRRVVEAAGHIAVTQNAGAVRLKAVNA